MVRWTDCVLLLLLLLTTLAGCSRTRYRVSADVDAYTLMRERTGGMPWSPPAGFDIMPRPDSRLYDPTPTDDPALPLPAPQLYAYTLPQLPEHDPGRFQHTHALDGSVSAVARQSAGIRQPFEFGGATGFAGDSELRSQADHRMANWAPEARTARLVPAVHWQDPATAAPMPALPMPAPQSDAALPYGAAAEGEVRIAPIPREAWEDLPASCRRRMYEFDSLREEYRGSFEREVPPDQLDTSPRLALEDIVALALLNSREYQTQKEVLYRVALRLSLERFDYALKFSSNGHRTSVDYAHNRDGGVTVNSLNIPTTLQADKMLLTGGDLLARFANNIVLTFNGPEGFAADVGSDLLFDLSQSVLQRDIRLENLTQAERDMIYAARDFASFRRQFFVDLATQYYNLLLTYRQIEIASQNYFSLVRTFHQANAEFQVELKPRFEVDQVEQQVLNGRTSVITACNSLERSFDNLKLRIGLPTETEINLDLTELEQLTLGDELSVAGELLLRVQERLRTDRAGTAPDRVSLLNSSITLIERVLDIYALRERYGEDVPDMRPLQTRRLQMLVESARLVADEVRQELESELRSASPSIGLIFQRSVALVDAQLQIIQHQLQLARHLHPESAQPGEFEQRATELAEQARAARVELDVLINESRLDELPQLVERAQALQRRAGQLVGELDTFNGTDAPPPPEQAREHLLAEVDGLLQLSDALLSQVGSGLVPVEIDVNDAMLTALVLRFDLMNERGFLADDWRQIKLAADDLRSVLDLSATQTISTRADVNRAFDFTFDESRTQLRLQFDAPLNRRSQRNAFRQALINYHAGLRQLMQLEDNIKLAVRNDLRDLSLNNERYQIGVASAALAFERKVSTTLAFQLGEVSARDLLEAQRDYTEALVDVARQHIDYILTRMQLFLDLEQLVVDEDGFWPQVYDEAYQPEAYYQLPPYAVPAYGELPHLLYSPEIRRMLQVPPGTSMIHGPHDSRESEPVPVPQPDAPNAAGGGQDRAG